MIGSSILRKAALPVWHYSLRLVLVIAVITVCLLAVLSLLLLRPWARSPIVEHTLPHPNDTPAAIVAAPDGAIWFTLDHSDAVGVVRGNAIQKIKTGSRSVESVGIAADFAGNIWFTDDQQLALGRIAPDGSVSKIPLPSAITRLGRVAAARDGSIWLAEAASNTITRLLDGVFTSYEILTADAGPFGLALDPEGNVWFSESYVGKLGRLSPTGEMSEFVIPTRASQPADVAADGSGAVWFTEVRGNKIGRFFDGRFDEYVVPTNRAILTSLAVADDGAVWFTETRGGKLGRLRDGKILELSLPSDSGRPFGVAIAPDGAVWYTDIKGRLGMVPAEVARSL